MNELDMALERLHLCAFESADARPNCGPMTALALELLGHAALTSGFVDVYVPRFPTIEDGTPLRIRGGIENAGNDHEDEWEMSRGRIACATDWLATFEAILAERDWQPVVSEVVARSFEAERSILVSTEGLMRLCFAIAGIEREDNATRQRELAFGLAYAMAKSAWQPQAGAEPAHQSMSVPSDPDEIDSLLSDFCLEGAQRYLATDASQDRVAAAMNVAAASAFRFLVPHLRPQSRAPILAALLSQCGGVNPRQENPSVSDGEEDIEVARCAESLNEIRYRAACSVHEHAILMADACLREDEIRPSPVYRRAAADAALRLSPPGYQEWR